MADEEETPSLAPSGEPMESAGTLPVQFSTPEEPEAPLDPAQHAQAARDAVARRTVKQPGYYKQFPDTIEKPKTTPPIEPEVDPNANPFDKFDHAADAGEPGLAERYRLNNVYAYYRNTARGSGTLALLAEIKQKTDAGAKPDELLAEYAPALVNARPDQQNHKAAALDWIKNAGQTYEDAIVDLATYEHIAPWGTQGDDPVYALGEFGAALAGQLSGSMSSPEAFLGAGGGAAASLSMRVLKAAVLNGGIMGAVDPVVQALSIRAGTQEHYDPWATVKAFGTGAIIGGGLHWGGEFVASHWLKSKRIELGSEDPQFRAVDDDKFNAITVKPHTEEPPIDVGEPVSGSTMTATAGGLNYEGPEPLPRVGTSEVERVLGSAIEEPRAPAAANGGAASQAQPEGEKLIGEPAPKMERHRVTTADGESIDVAPVVVEADSLVTSADKGFDPVMQPRDRDRAASQAQIRDMSANLDPERLGYSSEADRGAPIVGGDAMVESGNGRIEAIRQAYAENGEAAAKYRAWLEAQGVDVSKFKNPVLVRQNLTPMTPEQRRAFSVAANQGSTLQFSSTERAIADASHVSPDMLGLIKVPADLGAAGNRDFVRAFVGTLPKTEQGAMTDAAGNLSAEGLRRVREAVLGKAYGETRIMARLTEATDDEVKSISNALTQAAPVWAQLRSDIASGLVRADIDLTPELLEAVQRTADLRAKGIKLRDFLDQQDAFDKVSAPVEAWMRLFYDPSGTRAAGAQRIADALTFYAEEARKVSAEKGLDLGLAPVTSADIQASALANAGDMGGANAAQKDVLASGPGGNAPGNRTAGATADTGRRGRQPAGAKRPGGKRTRAERVAALNLRREEARGHPLESFDEFVAEQQGRSIEELHDDASNLQNGIKLASKAIIEGLPDVKFVNPGVKKLATAQEKIGRKGYADPGQMTDLARAGFIVKSPMDVEKVIARLGEHFEIHDEGYKITGTGYFDRKVLVRGADGTVGEIQIIPAPMYDAKKGSGTALYTKSRSMPAGAARDAIEEEQRALYQSALDKLGPEWGGKVPKSSAPNLGSNISRQAASDITAPDSRTSARSTSDQGAEGLRTANAASESNTAGRLSQSTNVRGEGAITHNIGTGAGAGNGEQAARLTKDPRQGDIFGGATATQKDLAQRRADERLRANVAQKPADFGLFGDGALQTDLVDIARASKQVPDLSVPYKRAIEEHNEAQAVYQDAVQAYRAKAIGDDEFIAAKKEYAKATEKFDKAFNTAAEKNTELAAIAKRQGGGTLPDEQKRPIAGMALPPSPPAVVPQGMTPQRAEAIKSLQQQTFALADALEFPLRQGRIQTRGASGVFKSDSGVVRVKEVADFEVVAHEAGHAIEAKAGPGLTAVMTRFASELTPLVQNPGAYKPSQYLAEGFAEYIRRYIGNPAFAQARAPTFTAAFKQFMDANHPGVIKALDDAAIGYRAYLDAPSVDAIHAVVRSQRENKGTWGSLVEQRREEGFPAVIRSVMSKAYEMIADDKHDWNGAVRALVSAVREKEGHLVELKAADNPEKLSRLNVRPQQAALQDSQYGVRPYHETAPRGPSMEEAISDAVGQPTAFGKWDQGKVDLFNDYLVARMGADRWDEFSRGEIPNPPVAFSKVDAQRAMQDIETALPQVRMASDKMHAYTRELLTKQYAGGLIDKDMYDKLMQKPFYTPLMRDLSDKPLAGGGMAKGRGSGDQAPNLIKAFRGSSRDIISPIESLMTQTYMVNRAIQENDVKLALLRLSQRAGIEGGRFAEAIPATEMKKYSFDLGSAIEKTAIEKGLDPMDAKVMAGAVTNTMGGDPVIGSFFRAEPAKGRGEPIVFYKEGGETKAMRVMADGEGFKLYELMTQAPEPVTDLWMHLIATAANIKRTGIITNPTFAISNYVRDQFTVGILRSDYIPIISGIKGIHAELTGGEAAHLYGYAGGVAGGAAVGAVEHAAENEINALAKKGYLVNRATSFKGVLELASVTEAGTRNSVFAKVFEAKKAQGLSDYEAMIEAASQAQDILDFSRHGSGTNAIRKILPFLNAHLQGLDKAKRVMLDPILDKIKGRQNLTTDSADFKNAMGAWVKTFGAGGALGAAYAAIAWQHEAYRDASPVAKGQHLIIPFGNKIITMPKPFELGGGFTLGEYAYAKLAKDDARSASQFYQAVMASLLPPNPLTDIPLVSTAGELMMNKSLFTGRDIVPQEYQRLAAQEQYNDRTSAVSKFLAKQIYETTGIGISPMKVDYAIGNEFGTWGRDLMSMSSGIDPDAPAQNWEDRVFLRRFIKDPTRSSDITTKYWGFMGQTSGTYNQAVATYDRFNDKFHDADAQRFLSQLAPNERAFVIMKSAADEDGKASFKADEKNLHPLQRSYEAVGVLNKLRKELGDNTFRTFASGENVRLDPVARRDLLDNVRELAQMEMRNAFVIMKEPGYAGRPMFDVNGPMDRIRHLSPTVADEIATRYATAKVYKTEEVAKAFPALQRELLRAGSQADLSTIAYDAQSSGYEFDGERAKRPQKRRTTIQPSMQ